MAEHAPDNNAAIPLAMHKEEGKWYVCVQFRRPRVADFSIEATKTDLLDALQIVYRHLGRYSFYELQAHQFDIQMGLYSADSLSAG